MIRCMEHTCIGHLETDSCISINIQKFMKGRKNLKIPSHHFWEIFLYHILVVLLTGNFFTKYKFLYGPWTPITFKFYSRKITKNFKDFQNSLFWKVVAHAHCSMLQFCLYWSKSLQSNLQGIDLESTSFVYFSWKPQVCLLQNISTRRLKKQMTLSQSSGFEQAHQAP